MLLVFSPAQGQNLFRKLSRIDQRAANASFQAALEYNTSGTAANWNNPDADISGMTVPVKTLRTASGQRCREYSQTISINNNRQQNHGTACRQADGHWRIVDPQTLKPRIVKTVKVKKPKADRPHRVRYYDPYWSDRYRYSPARFYFGFGYSVRHGHIYLNNHWPVYGSRYWPGYDPWRWRYYH